MNKERDFVVSSSNGAKRRDFTFFRLGRGVEIFSEKPLRELKIAHGQVLSKRLSEAVLRSKKWLFFCNWLILRLTVVKLLITFDFMPEATPDFGIPRAVSGSCVLSSC